jgi:sulfate/thiosulfate transport system substrate-binding protein
MLRKLLLSLLGLYVLAAGVWVAASGFTRHEQLLNVACDPTRELWRDVNQAFVADHEKQTGVTVGIRQSHGGSGSQARAVIDGLPADVVTLALWTDTDAIRKAGLMDADWENKLPNRSLPYISTIVFVVRKGNPKRITDWPHLANPNVGVITPDPKASGNGKWSFLAMWGAVVTRGGSEQKAEEFVTTVYRNVPVLGAAAREATITFAKHKIGDVHLTWENEAFLEVQESNGELEIVHPPVSVRAEPHVALVDSVVDKKGSRETAEAYLKFLYTPEAQRIIAKHYHRPTRPEIEAETRAQFPKIDLFPATACGPNWDAINKRFFGEGGVFDRIYADRRAK